jgi:choline kinase
MKAIILSAGQGKRLLPMTSARPKCLLAFAGRTLLEWQLRILAVAGVGEAVVVTGFGVESVEETLAGIDLPGVRVRTLFNPFYGVADNIGSCFLALPEMTGDFLVVNGDTLFEPAIPVKLLAEAAAPVTVTIDRKAQYDADDMKVSLDRGQDGGRRLRAIGKTLPPDNVDGESIGLLLFRDEGGRHFAEAVQAVLREPGGARRWYLSAIDRLARGGEGVEAVSIEGRQWAEVDFPADAERARRLVEGWVATGRLAAMRAAE